MFSFSSRLYPITDTCISSLSHAQQVAQLSEGGAQLIQIREKHLAPRSFYREAQAAVQQAHQSGVRLIINDRPDIALVLGADGVHLGQDDLPAEAARALLGAQAIIGLSTHNVAQAQTAAKLPIDYIAIGPIFASRTKVNPEPTVGLVGLRQVRDVIGGIPLVAIGGITAENAPQVIAAGADAVAVISALLTEDASICDNTRRFLQRL
ncbi:MAG: thiamine phosphate synthase [Acidobacteriota bacterium]|nr:thiamine phosphate synthase [Acidobacteriota bacterium]